MIQKLTDPELKRQFKVLEYKIKSYGDSKAIMEIYVDNFGDFDIGSSELFLTVPDRHNIIPSQQIIDYIEKFIQDLYEYSEDDRYYYIDVVFDVNQNILNFNIHRYYIESEFNSVEYSFDHLSNEFNKVSKKYSYMKRAEITYDGGGDSGWIDNTVTYKKDKKYKLNSSKNEDDDIIENQLYHLLEDSFGAWGNDEGGYGKIFIDFKEKIIVIEHNENVEQSELIQNLLQIDLN